MSVITVRWVFWVSLLVSLPFPFYIVHWGLLPLGAVLKALVFGHLQQLYELSLLQVALVLLQCLVAAVVFGLTSWGYGRYASQWQEKIRGSVVGIVMLSFLITFSSIAVYSDQLVARNTDDSVRKVTFLQVYP
jgi:hypothetical protein